MERKFMNMWKLSSLSPKPNGTDYRKERNKNIMRQMKMETQPVMCMRYRNVFERKDYSCKQLNERAHKCTV